MQKKVLITGGAGFIGSNLAKRLVQLNYKVVIVDNLSNGKKENIPDESIFYQADIRNKEEIDPIILKEKPDYISHHAAQINLRFSITHPIEDADVNILGTINILESMKKLKKCHFIFASSGGALYKNTNVVNFTEDADLSPLSPYGVSKLAAEKYALLYSEIHSVPCTILRYSNVYGPFQDTSSQTGVIAKFIHMLLQQEVPTIYGDGCSIRDYIYIDDVVEANYLAMSGSATGVYNVATSVPTSTLELFKEVSKQLRCKINPHFSEKIVGEQVRSTLDYTKAFNQLKWRPQFTLEEGIKKTIIWQKELLKQNRKNHL